MPIAPFSSYFAQTNSSKALSTAKGLGKNGFYTDRVCSPWSVLHANPTHAFYLVALGELTLGSCGNAFGVEEYPAVLTAS